MLDAFGKGASEDIRMAKALVYHQMTYQPGSSAAPTPPPSTLPGVSPWGSQVGFGCVWALA
jgi:hypothetical protein